MLGFDLYTQCHALLNIVVIAGAGAIAASLGIEQEAQVVNRTGVGSIPNQSR